METKREAEADREHDELVRHNNTKISITLENFRSIFDDTPNKVRLEIIKSLIWTSNNSEEMLHMVQNLVVSKKFEITID